MSESPSEDVTLYMQGAMKKQFMKYCAVLLLILIVACGKERPARRADADQTTAAQSLVSSQSVTDWPTFMHDISYLGRSPDKTLRPPLGLIWKFKTGGPVDSSPVVADQTVYVGSDDHRMYALHAHKWGVKWDFEAGDSIIYAPTVYDGTVYFSARDNKVYALDAATGAKKWEFQADGWINAPVVASRQKIYFGCYDSKIYVLNAVTGKRESQELSSIEIDGFRYTCSRGEFYPMDARYRASRWREKIPASQSWPATANRFVYIGARDSILRAFDEATGKEIWQFRTGGWVDSSPAIANGMLYFGSRDGYIYAFGNADVSQAAEQNGRKQGVVTQDRVRVYDQLDDNAKIIALLNEGRQLPMTGRQQENWYEVTMPDGQVGWISRLDFIPVRWVGELQMSDVLVKDVRSVTLPRKAEEASWSPNGSIVVFFNDISAQSLYWRAKSFWLASSDGSDPAWVTDGSFLNPRVSWSGDSGWIAMENLAHPEREIWIVKYNGTGLKKVANGEAPALSPRGSKMAFIRRGNAATAIWVRELANGTEAKIAEIPMRGDGSRAAYSYIADLNAPAWSPGGSRLAIGFDSYHYPDGYSRLVVITVSGEVVREIAVRAERIKDVAWSPDGSHLAYVTQGYSTRGDTGQLERQVHLTNLDRSSSNSAIREVFEDSEGIAWSPDGQYMAFIEENDCMGLRRKVWLFDVNMYQRIQLLASRANIRKVFWFNDGRIGLLASSPPSDTAPRTRGWIVSIASLPG